MTDVCELTKFTASGKALRLVMDIAAALERYKIAMEGPEGVILRTIKAIEKNIRQLKDAQCLRRVGPDKGGHWEVA